MPELPTTLTAWSTSVRLMIGIGSTSRVDTRLGGLLWTGIKHRLTKLLQGADKPISLRTRSVGEAISHVFHRLGEFRIRFLWGGCCCYLSVQVPVLMEVGDCQTLAIGNSCLDCVRTRHSTRTLPDAFETNNSSGYNRVSGKTSQLRRTTM